MVNYWADLGFTSFKAYTNITRAQLGSAIRAAHARGLKVTGHLCSVTFREAADLGIDSLEHGISASTDFVPSKEPDLCPARTETKAIPRSDRAEVQGLIKYLVSKKVAIVSTLPVAEAGVPGRPPLQQRFLDVLSPMARTDYLIARARTDAERGARGSSDRWTSKLAFVARGRHAARRDSIRPATAASSPASAISAKSNCWSKRGSRRSKRSASRRRTGADFLGEGARIGTLAVGKQADITIVSGDPSARIADIENVEVVFKDGKGYDSKKLIESVKGMVGSR